MRRIMLALLGFVLTSAGLQLMWVAVVTAQSPTDIEIAFDGVYSIGLEFRAPIRAALETNTALLNGNRQFTVSAYRDTVGWAKVTLVPTSYVDSGWANIETVTPHLLEVIMQQVAPYEWTAYLVGSPAFDTVAGVVPREFVDTVSTLPDLDGYQFPWASDQSWWAIQNWHDGNALDFQPGVAARYGVLAAGSGRLREICSDGYQSLLQIQHADGRETYYLHVRLALSVRRRLLDQNVMRGQYLGELIGYAPFLSACGQGNSRHLHFAVSDPNMMIQDYPIAGIADSASCCANPPLYMSTNQRVDASDGG
jgi:murein DD-endopeptidase MepM/ murein hydrolase activator NlpD